MYVCLASLLLIAALGAVAVAAWLALGKVSALADLAGGNRTPQPMRIAAVERNVAHVSLQIRHAMLVRPASVLDSAQVPRSTARPASKPAPVALSAAVPMAGDWESFYAYFVNS